MRVTSNGICSASDHMSILVGIDQTLPPLEPVLLSFWAAFISN